MGVRYLIEGVQDLRSASSLHSVAAMVPTSLNYWLVTHKISPGRTKLVNSDWDQLVAGRVQKSKVVVPVAWCRLQQRDLLSEVWWFVMLPVGGCFIVQLVSE